MKALYSVFFLVFILCGYHSSALAQDIEIYDQDGNYSYGEVDKQGNVEIYDQDGNYSYGEVDKQGNVEIYDQDGNYSYGEVDR